MLTSSQKRVLDYIVAQIDATDMTPTYRVMAAALGRASAGSVHATVDQLVQRGFLERRGIELRILRRPEQRVAYFRFDDESKQLVPWRPEVRKVS